MKAVRLHRYGGPEELRYEDAPDPVPGPGEVVVRVRACALNHLDVWTRMRSTSQELPQPHILGSDIAGVVEELGEGVTGWSVGDEVMVAPAVSCGRCVYCLSGQDNLCADYATIGSRPGLNGGYAELAKVPAANLLPKPKNLSFEEAAAIPLVFITAGHMLGPARADLRAGEDLLVHAGGSGVGSAAIQIGKLRGARVFTTVGSDEKIPKAQALGADEVINYNTADFVAEVRRFTDSRGVDVVLDSVGGRVFEQSLRVVARTGRLVSCGATAEGTVTFQMAQLFLRHITILGSSMGTKGELVQMLPLFAAGKLKGVVHRALPLAEAALAHQIMGDRQNFGKIVLIP